MHTSVVDWAGLIALWVVLTFMCALPFAPPPLDEPARLRAFLQILLPLGGFIGLMLLVVRQIGQGNAARAARLKRAQDILSRTGRRLTHTLGLVAALPLQWIQGPASKDMFLVAPPDAIVAILRAGGGSGWHGETLEGQWTLSWTGQLPLSGGLTVRAMDAEADVAVYRQDVLWGGGTLQLTTPLKNRRFRWKARNRDILEWAILDEAGRRMVTVNASGAVDIAVSATDLPELTVLTLASWCLMLVLIEHEASKDA